MIAFDMHPLITYITLNSFVVFGNCFLTEITRVLDRHSGVGKSVDIMREEEREEYKKNRKICRVLLM